MSIERCRSQGAHDGVLAWLLIGGALALVIAYWFWVFLVRPLPLSSILVEGGADRLANKIQTRHLFGVMSGIVGSVPAVSDTAQMTLAGIVSSGSAKRGVAIIVVDGKKAVTARVGQEIVPDIVLSRVAHDHVELTRRGQIINLRLAIKK